uniref:Uncharacterized protein n=1 Tax=Arundo donax TaxID=35708 RepID=A0A0A9A0M9_ARUDO
MVCLERKWVYLPGLYLVDQERAVDYTALWYSCGYHYIMVQLWLPLQYMSYSTLLISMLQIH